MESRKLLFLVSALIVLVVGYVFFSKDFEQEGEMSAYDAAHRSDYATDSLNHEQAALLQESESPNSVASSPPVDGFLRKLILNVSIKSAKKLPVFRLSENEAVVFIVSSDVDGVLAVHGITEELVIQRGKSVNFNFIAEVTGRFLIHVHEENGKHLEVGIVEVLPN